MGIDPGSSAVILGTDLAPYSSYLLNMEIGLLVSGFKVSYRWIKFNVMDSNINNSINPSSYSIKPIRHLEIVWQFLN